MNSGIEEIEESEAETYNESNNIESETNPKYWDDEYINQYFTDDAVQILN